MPLFLKLKPVLIPGPTLCYQCKKTAAKGRTLCEYHAAKAAGLARDARLAKNNYNKRKRYYEAKAVREQG